MKWLGPRWPRDIAIGVVSSLIATFIPVLIGRGADGLQPLMSPFLLGLAWLTAMSCGVLTYLSENARGFVLQGKAGKVFLDDETRELILNVEAKGSEVPRGKLETVLSILRRLRSELLILAKAVVGYIDRNVQEVPKGKRERVASVLGRLETVLLILGVAAGCYIVVVTSLQFLSGPFGWDLSVD